MPHSNVVQLNSGLSTPAKAVGVKLPLPLTQLRVRCGVHLKQMMAGVFDRIDDTFFDLADKASSNSEQGAYFDAMRLIRLQKSAITSNFLKACQQDFEFKPEHLNVDTVSVHSAQRTCDLAMVDHDDVEKQVAVDNIIHRIKSEAGLDLDHLTQRFAALLPTVDLQENRNPLGAHRLAHNFAEACRPIEIDTRSRLVVYKVFEKQVLSQLKSMLSAANKYLAEQGVMPDLSVVRTSRGAGRGAGRSAGQRNSGGANRSHPSGQQPVAAVSKAGGSSLGGQLSHGWQSAAQFDPLAMMAQVQDQLPAFDPQGVAAGLPVLRQPSLINALSVAQNSLSSDVFASSSAVGSVENAALVNESGLINFVNLLQRMIKDKNGQPRAQIDQTDQNAINLVTMLFDFILEDRQLQTPVKALLSRLQIPLVKVALIDKSFFHTGGHIARKLLNELAMAAVGWTEKAQGLRDPFLTKLEAVVLRIVNEFKDDLYVFHEVLEDFQRFQEAERKRRRLVEQRTRDSEEGRAAADAAKRFVQNKLNDMLAGHTIPDFVLQILREDWSSYMVLLSLKHGNEHLQLAEAAQTAASLIELTSQQCRTASPTQDAREEIIEKLKNGLSQAACQPYELHRRINELKQYLCAGVRQQKIDKIMLSNRPVSEVLNDRPSDRDQVKGESPAGSGKVASHQKPDHLATSSEASGITASGDDKSVLQTSADLNEPGLTTNPHIELLKEAAEARAWETDPSSLLAVERLSIGSWVEFREAEDKCYRTKLAAIIKTIDRYIFVNRMGVKVAEKSKAALVQQFKDNTIRLLDDSLLFDRALESVITTLRK